MPYPVNSVFHPPLAGGQFHYDHGGVGTGKFFLLTENEFYPSYLESHLTGIRTTLESGAPTLRNKKAGLCYAFTF